MTTLRIFNGDCLEEMEWMASESVQCCVTSPPYFGLRDYGHNGQIGLEETPEQYVMKLVEVFREVRRILKPDGTLWLNLGDSYAGSGCGNYNKIGRTQAGVQHITNVRNRSDWLANAGLKAKDLIGIPWMVAFALRADGWYLRQDIVWHKPNPMPESVRDRCTKAHEYIFLLSKSPKYFFDSEAMKEAATSGATGSAASFKRSNSKRAQAIPNQSVGTHREDRDDVSYNLTRNRRSVWSVPTRPYKGAHFAVYPSALIEPCILAGSRYGDVVFDPFGGSGTTAEVAIRNGRKAVLCELNPEYIPLIRVRTDAALLEWSTL